jgi:Radical SAM superfamily/4Fe-4S single cluster domain
MNKRFIIQHLETHVTHGCNLTCEGCTHFSNNGHSGRHTPASFQAELEPWSRRLVPDTLQLLGGEPTLNPELCDILPLARAMWPGQRILLVTNGFFLHKHPKLPEVLKRHKIIMAMSVHHDSPEYTAKMKEVKALTDSWGIRVSYWPSLRNWTRAIQGAGKDVKPYADGDPKRSWHQCISRWCMNIHEGKLWKCPVLAYLPMQDKKFGLSDEWKPYLAYEPLSPDCSDDELQQFLARKWEAACGMCPANPEPFKKPNPMIPLGTIRRPAKSDVVTA